MKEIYVILQVWCFGVLLRITIDEKNIPRKTKQQDDAPGKNFVSVDIHILFVSSVTVCRKKDGLY